MTMLLTSKFHIMRDRLKDPNISDEELITISEEFLKASKHIRKRKGFTESMKNLMIGYLMIAGILLIIISIFK